MTTVTQAKVERLEEMARDHAWHEPDCPVRMVERSKSTVPPKKLPVCSCWLSESG